MSKRQFGMTDAQLGRQAGAVTKTASFNGAALDLGAGYAPVPSQPVQFSVPVSAADFTSTDETYKLELEESADNSTWTKAGAAVSVLAGDVGAAVIVEGLVATRYVRYALTIGGTTPSITYGP